MQGKGTLFRSLAQPVEEEVTIKTPPPQPVEGKRTVLKLTLRLCEGKGTLHGEVPPPPPPPVEGTAPLPPGVVSNEKPAGIIHYLAQPFTCVPDSPLEGRGMGG